MREAILVKPCAVNLGKPRSAATLIRAGLILAGAMTTPLTTGAALAAPVAVHAARAEPKPAAQPSPRAQIAEARATLQRLGVDTAPLAFTITTGTAPAYRVRASAGRIAVSGTSPVALVRGAARYLEQRGSLAVSWEGVRVRPLSAPVAAYDSGLVTSPFGLRAYLNTCTFGYTTPWWDWARWQREIDWMAVRGIDTPLAMEGQEYVWRALWREEGLGEGAIAASLSAAPYLPWQRMGNIAGFRAPLSAGWIARKQVLQQRILARMRALGMKPVLPAFSGYVPESWAKAHPRARVYRMREWEGFAGTYWLDPSDPEFARLARRFIALYTAAYGPGQYYLADAFNEMVPPIADDGTDLRGAAYGDATANTAATRAAALPRAVRDARLAAYGERLYRSIADAAPGATWVMQGWLFGADKAFWTPDAIAAFLSQVPDDRMLILDIGNDRYPGTWQQTGGFDGKRWVYGYVHNYGGSNPVYGDPAFYRADLSAVLTHPARGNLAGFGMFPEGLHNNSLVYAYAYDLAWGDVSPDGTALPLRAWLGSYTRGRYGRTSRALVGAWEKIIAGAYATRYWTPRWWQERAGAYLFFKSPTVAGADYPPAPGDMVALREGLDELLALAPGIEGEPLYRHDLIELARHYASLRLDQRLAAAVAAYRDGDIAGGDRAARDVGSLATRVDRLIGGQQETLGSWIGDARAYGTTPAQKAAFAEQAKAIVTQWGGEGHLSDYASRAWQGLYAGYYLPRWRIFLAAQRAAAVAHQPFNEAATHAAIRRWEGRWIADGRTWPTVRPAAPMADLRALLKEADRR